MSATLSRSGISMVSEHVLTPETSIRHLTWMDGNDECTLRDPTPVLGLDTPIIGFDIRPEGEGRVGRGIDGDMSAQRCESYCQCDQMGPHTCISDQFPAPLAARCGRGPCENRVYTIMYRLGGILELDFVRIIYLPRRRRDKHGVVGSQPDLGLDTRCLPISATGLLDVPAYARAPQSGLSEEASALSMSCTTNTGDRVAGEVGNRLLRGSVSSLAGSRRGGPRRHQRPFGAPRSYPRCLAIWPTW